MSMKTWQDIEEAARNEPILHMMVTLVERGDMTREQALIAAVLGLAEIKTSQHAQIVEFMRRRPAAPSVLAHGDAVGIPAARSQS